MRKLITLLIVGLMMMCNIAAAEETFSTWNNFRVTYNLNAAFTRSGNNISEDGIITIQGGLYDTYRANLTSNCLIQVTIKHPERSEELSRIDEVLLMYVPDNNEDSTTRFLYGMGEIAMTTGGISSVEDISSFFKELGFDDDMEKRNASGKVEIGGLTYSYVFSSSLGYMFFVYGTE